MNDEFRRRTFLESLAGGAPAVRLLTAAMAQGGAATADVAADPLKFTPLDLGAHYNGSPADLGRREEISGWGPDGLLHTPAGSRQFRGIPFHLGKDGAESKRWLVLSSESKPWTTTTAQIAVGSKSNYVCLAQFCLWEPKPADRTIDYIPQAGQVLAHCTLIYEDGSEHTLPIRRRLEVCAPTTAWGQKALLALAHPQMKPRHLTDRLPSGAGWGLLQTLVAEDGGAPYLWICALRNPNPERVIKTIRLSAAASDLIAVAGLTLFHGTQHPLRYERLAIYRITLPEALGEDHERWKLSVDLGVVARQYALPEFESNGWTESAGAGLGGRAEEIQGARYLYAEITASPEATLSLGDNKTNRLYLFDLGKAAPGKDLPARSSGARVELVERDRAWLHARVVDPATARPVPVRLAFRSKEGRYLPPYGHRAEINAAWFQDYGADVKMGADSFAYVDGEFQVELPVGDVYVEMAKGFEYSPVRRKLHIAPGQRELTLEISKHADLRAAGWVNADTHVHFLSPSTAVLEGQAEGLNLVNLLSAQWGDLYTNIGDMPHGPLTSRDGEMVVWPGSENRNHMLGHIGLLGGKGQPIFPLTGGFPYGSDESYLGDPLWMSMSEWADTCRERDGLTVAVHFPNPWAEIIADIVLGKIDAIEVPAQPFSNDGYGEWYRFLNCGYRLPIAGGTDKMGAGTAVGRSRTYAYIGQDAFNFANWARAVRKGNTFSTSGPLLLLGVDGRVPGEEIEFRAGGGTLEVEAHARCFTPIHNLEIVVNGKVAASRQEKHGAREIVLREKIAAPGPAWIAARCESQPPSGVRWGRVAAHTSPVYLTVPGRQLFSAPIASYLMTLINGTQDWVETIATRADPERYQRVRKVLIDARAKLQQRTKA